jgi:hypothetical protein
MKSNNLMKVLCYISPRKSTKPAALCIIALLTISMLSFLTIAGVMGATATTTTFGNTNADTVTAQMGFGQINLCRFQATTTGTITALNLYCKQDPASPRYAMVRPVVYSDNNGAPGSLLGIGTNVQLPTSFNWVQLQGLSVSEKSGTYYWIGQWITNNALIRYAVNKATTSTNEMAYSYWNYNNAPSTFRPTGYANWMASVYATVISSETTPTTTPSTTPTPTPTTTLTPQSSVNNLATTPTFWRCSYSGQMLAIGSSDAATAASISYPVTKGGQTAIELRHNPTVLVYGGPNDRELDGAWTPIRPGDHIVYSAYLWADPSSIGDTFWRAGANFGLDFYSNNGRICEIATPTGITSYPNWPSSMSQTVVSPGSGGWVHIKIDFTVQSQYLADPYTGGQPADVMITPTGIVPWINWVSSNPSAESAKMWIYGTELYINP